MATREFSEAVSAMAGDANGETSADLWVKAERTRLASENARLLLKMHREEHGC